MTRARRIGLAMYRRRRAERAFWTDVKRELRTMRDAIYDVPRPPAPVGLMTHCGGGLPPVLIYNGNAYRVEIAPDLSLPCS